MSTISALVLAVALAAEPKAAPPAPASEAKAPAAATAPGSAPAATPNAAEPTQASSSPAASPASAGAATPAPAPEAPAPAAAAPAPAPAPKKGNYLRLAAPTFSAVNLDEKVASFFSEHFAGALVRRGVLVLTPSEINAMIGLERSKQLAGCTEDASNCVAELSNALGVDGLIVGTAAKFGRTLQANIKVFAAPSGTSLKAISVKASGEEAFLEALSKEAAVVAPDLLQRTGREPAPTLELEAKPVRINVISVGAIPALISIFANQTAQWYSLEYERVLNGWLGIFATPTLINLNAAPETLLPRENPVADATAPYKVSLLRLEAGVRLYWPGKAPGGWWAAPQVGVGSGAITTATKSPTGAITLNPEEYALDFAAGLTLGYRWYPVEMVPVTVGVGFELHNNRNLLGLPLGRLHVGFAW